MRVNWRAYETEVSSSGFMLGNRDSESNAISLPWFPRLPERVYSVTKASHGEGRLYVISMYESPSSEVRGP